MRRAISLGGVPVARQAVTSAKGGVFEPKRQPTWSDLAEVHWPPPQAERPSRIAVLVEALDRHGRVLHSGAAVQEADNYQLAYAVRGPACADVVLFRVTAGDVVSVHPVEQPLGLRPGDEREIRLVLSAREMANRGRR